jgi:hypothetical protein
MENPLLKFVKTEDRPDGVYITVPRESKDALSVKAMINALEQAQVVNFDVKTIEDVVSRLRGAPEKIGPPFEYYDAAIEPCISVYIESEKAFMQIKSECCTPEILLSPARVIYCLKNKGVRHGIKPDVIAQALALRQFDDQICIAEGTKPVDGRDGRVKFEVDYNPDSRPHLRPDGGVDYREIKSFVQVAAGQVLATKIPPTAGTAGVSVTGEPIPAKPGKEISLPAGENTEVSEDGLSLKAVTSGYLEGDALRLNVKDRMLIVNDIDFSIGNIKFSGELEIKGGVKPGFSVEAGKNILIHGQVESANIKSREGSVTIVKGVLGKNKCAIFAKTKIELQFIQDATIETDGIVTVAKHCLNCLVTCATFKSEAPGANLVGGTLTATDRVIVTQIGTGNGADTRIVLVDKTKGEARKKLKEFIDIKQKILAALDPIKKQVTAKAAIFKKAGDLITDRQKAELKKWIDQYNVLQMKCNHVQKRIDALHTQISSADSFGGFVKVTGVLYPGTIFNFYGITKSMLKSYTKKLFRIGNNGEIIMEEF